MFKLGEDSIVVQTYLSMYLNGKLTLEQIPVFFGIREAVQSILDKMNKEEA